MGEAAGGADGFAHHREGLGPVACARRGVGLGDQYVGVGRGLRVGRQAGGRDPRDGVEDVPLGGGPVGGQPGLGVAADLSQHLCGQRVGDRQAGERHLLAGCARHGGCRRRVRRGARCGVRGRSARGPRPGADRAVGESRSGRGCSPRLCPDRLGDWPGPRGRRPWCVRRRTGSSATQRSLPTVVVAMALRRRDATRKEAGTPTSVAAARTRARSLRAPCCSRRETVEAEYPSRRPKSGCLHPRASRPIRMRPPGSPSARDQRACPSRAPHRVDAAVHRRLPGRHGPLTVGARPDSRTEHVHFLQVACDGA